MRSISSGNTAGAGLAFMAWLRYSVSGLVLLGERIGRTGGQVRDQQVAQMLAQGLVRQRFEGGTAKRQREQAKCLRQRNPARTQVEQRALVELADGRAMRGLDLVGVDLEFRFGVDLGLVREQQVLVAQGSVATVSTLRHDDGATEHAARTAVGDATPERVRRGVACVVTHL